MEKSKNVIKIAILTGALNITLNEFIHQFYTNLTFNIVIVVKKYNENISNLKILVQLIE